MFSGSTDITKATAGHYWPMAVMTRGAAQDAGVTELDGRCPRCACRTSGRGSSSRSAGCIACRGGPGSPIGLTDTRIIDPPSNRAARPSGARSDRGRFGNVSGAVPPQFQLGSSGTPNPAPEWSAWATTSDCSSKLGAMRGSPAEWQPFPPQGAPGLWVHAAVVRSEPACHPSRTTVPPSGGTGRRTSSSPPGRPSACGAQPREAHARTRTRRRRTG